MRRILPLALLIPALLLFGFFTASLFGFSLPYGTPANTLFGAVAWLLLFLIVHGHLYGWRSVRLFLILFAGLKFSMILHAQLTSNIPAGRSLIQLTGALILTWFLFALFWPRRSAQPPNYA
jgi:hypothetical protein